MFLFGGLRGGGYIFCHKNNMVHASKRAEERVGTQRAAKYGKSQHVSTNYMNISHPIYKIGVLPLPFLVLYARFYLQNISRDMTKYLK